MVALPQIASDRVTGNGWQDMRHQLFGHKRERDAQDRLLAVLTQLETRIGSATGVFDGALRSPAKRGQLLRALQEGVNDLISWHRSQIEGARAAGLFHSPVPDAALDSLVAARHVSELFEGAHAAGTRVDCTDVIAGIAQLRGEESDVYFYQALTGMLAMLRSTYERAALDAPTTPTAEALRGTWDVLVEEIEALAGPPPAPPPVAVLEEPQVIEVSDDFVGVVEAAEMHFEVEDALDVEPEAVHFEISAASEIEVPAAAEISAASENEVPAAAELEIAIPPDEMPNVVMFPTRFFRMNLVAC